MLPQVELLDIAFIVYLVIFDDGVFSFVNIYWVGSKAKVSLLKKSSDGHS